FVRDRLSSIVKLTDRGHVQFEGDGDRVDLDAFQKAPNLCGAPHAPLLENRLYQLELLSAGPASTWRFFLDELQKHVVVPDAGELAAPIAKPLLRLPHLHL